MTTNRLLVLVLLVCASFSFSPTVHAAGACVQTVAVQVGSKTKGYVTNTTNGSSFPVVTYNPALSMSDTQPLASYSVDATILDSAGTPHSLTSSCTSAPTYSYTLTNAYTGHGNLFCYGNGTLVADGITYTLTPENQNQPNYGYGYISYGGDPNQVPQACSSVQPPVAILTTTPSNIVSGNTTNLTYSCSNGATSATIDNGVGTLAVPASGSIAVSPTTDTLYNLTCTNNGGTGTAKAAVTVSPAFTGSCSVSPTTISAGQSATWTATSNSTKVSSYSWSGTDGLMGTSASVSYGYSSAGTKTGNVTMTSGGQTISVPCSNSLTVTPSSLPDLTANFVFTAPQTATQGIPVLLRADVTNKGNNTTGGAFHDLFQRATDASGSDAKDIGTFDSGGPLAIGDVQNATLNHTFPTEGPWYLRVCADKNFAADAGVITESDETNNCGPWTLIPVNPAAPATVSCIVSPSAIAPGGTATYTATPANGATGSYTWLDSDGWDISSAGVTISRTYTNSGTYAMQVKGSNTGFAYCSTNLTVGGSSCTGPANLSITAAPERGKVGSTTLISWSATNVGTASDGTTAICKISGPGLLQTLPPADPTSCDIPSGSSSLTITQQSTYTLTCNDGSSKSILVNVLPNITEF